VDLNNLVPWLFIAAVLVFVVPASVYMYTLQQRRSKAYVAFAAANGYQYVFKRPGQEAAYVNVLPMFNQGHSRTWQHELSGAFNGLAFTAFEYVYIIGYGKNQTVHRQAMIKWESAGASLPQFTLGPEGFFARIGQALGWPDIDFSDDEAFSRSYVLKGSDEAAVRALFTPELRAQLSSEPGQHVAGMGKILLWWRNGSLPGPESFGAFLTAGDRVRQVFFAG